MKHRSLPSRLSALLALTLLVAVGRFALAAAPHFRFERTVQPAGAGPNRIDPDVALLAGARPDLADLRLYDGGGREVPYLFVSPERQEASWRSGHLLPIAATKTGSGFEVDLGAVALVDRLRLEGLGAPFLKRFRLEGGGDRSRWTVLVEQGTMFDLPDEGLTRTEAGFQAGEYRYLRLTWDDRSSAVLRPPAAAAARGARSLNPLAAMQAAVAFERRESEPGKSRFHLRLPGAALPIVGLELEVGGGNLLRRAEVSQGRLGNGEVTPVSLGSSTLRRAVRGDLAATDLRIPIQAQEGPELELTVDDGDNPPLDLKAVKIELAPLPWIYFEVEDGQPLTARYGDPEAAAPSYDLEAARSSLGRARVAPARWGAAPAGATSSPPTSGKAPLPTLGAPLQEADFQQRRAVPTPKGAGGGAILTSLLLDAAVLDRSPDLGDLRLADASGHQIPYLVERRNEPLTLALPALALLEAAKEKPSISRYRLVLPYGTLPEARLVLATSARVFERQVALVRLARNGRAPGRSGEGMEETLAAAGWRHADPEAAAARLVLDLPRVAAGELEIRIDDGDNAPLPLEAPLLLLPAVRLRFFHPGGEVHLLYGNAGLGAPRYDLALLAPRLLGAAAEEVSLAPEGGREKGASDADPDALPKKLFWGGLILAVVVLLVVLARLLREKGEGGAGS